MINIVEGAKDFARITVTATMTTKLLASVHINFFEERLAMMNLLLVEPKVFLHLWNKTIHFLNKVIFCKTSETRGLARGGQIHVAFSIMPSIWI
jgi:hypothetical protein